MNRSYRNWLLIVTGLTASGAVLFSCQPQEGARDVRVTHAPAADLSTALRTASTPSEDRATFGSTADPAHGVDSTGGVQLGHADEAFARPSASLAFDSPVRPIAQGSMPTAARATLERHAAGNPLTDTGSATWNGATIYVATTRMSGRMYQLVADQNGGLVRMVTIGSADSAPVAREAASRQ